MHQQLSHQRRDDVDTILSRIESDPAFRQRIFESPAAVIRALAIDPSADVPADVFGFCKGVTCKARTCVRSIVTR
jgi:hypothetical protein